MGIGGSSTFVPKEDEDDEAQRVLREESIRRLSNDEENARWLKHVQDRAHDPDLLHSNNPQRSQRVKP